MNYIFNRDITVKYTSGHMVSDESIKDFFLGLLANGYVDEVPDDAYEKDNSELYNKTHENGVPLDKLKTISQFKEAFQKRRIRYDPFWRIEDYRHKANRWCINLTNAEMKRRMKRRQENREKYEEYTKRRNGEEY